MRVPSPKMLVFVSLCGFFIIGAILLYQHETAYPKAIAIDVHDQPTLGVVTAAIQIVVFEEPKCVNCRLFNQQVYPKIKEKYIDTQQASYTVIPVSFLPGSMAAAEALLCVYHSNAQTASPELYFAYLDALYAKQPPESVDWVQQDLLLQYAQETSEHIPVEGLKQCLVQGSFRSAIEQNTNYGQQVMGGALATPSVFINGVALDTLSFEQIEDLIERLRMENGVT